MSISEAIETLRLALPGVEFALRGTEEHNSLNRSSYQSALQSDIVPACIVRPRTKEDISAFVKTIKPFVLANKAAFAIVGGGRQPAPGCSNIQDGITLNLDLLTGIKVNDGIVSIAAGENWGSVYDKLVEQGLGCSGSRSGKGGIGGLALSGGLSFFSSREGFICDDASKAGVMLTTFLSQVMNYELVLGSGEVVNANVNENADLWKALRGGGNNFGVITRYDMRTFKQGWGFILLQPEFPQPS
ncbi:FAD binding domain-containing protein [Seiridium cupressi]